MELRVRADGSLASPIQRSWSYIAPGATDSVGGTFTRRRIDRIIALAASAASVVLGVQSLLIALSDDAGLPPPWSPWVLGLVFGLLFAMCIACLFERTARVGAGVFAVAYVVVLALWLPLANGDLVPTTPEPWVWYLLNLATIAAVVAFPTSWQIAWTLGVPLLYGGVRLLHGDGSLAAWGSIVFEVPFALILGSLLLVLATAFRRLGSGVDAARARTVAGYAAAAEAQAAQEERVAVSALMHDSVLGALIAAERAETPRERTLAVSMAQEALAGLADTGEGAQTVSSEPTTVSQLAERIRSAASEFGISVPVTVGQVAGCAEVPASVAQAITRASTQAIANAIQHADARGLQVRVGPASDEPAPAGWAASGPAADGPATAGPAAAGGATLGRAGVGDAPTSTAPASTEPATADAPDAAPDDSVADHVDANRPPAGVEVEVRDSGPGFDLDDIPADRLGITASIIARMAAVGGTARIHSDRTGTRITLRWSEAES